MTPGDRWSLRVLRGCVLLIVLAQSLPGSVEAKSSHGAQKACKQVREAVGAGATLEELTQRFNMDAEHVMKCLQSRGRRRASPKGKKVSKRKGHSGSPQPSTRPATR